MTDEDEIRTYRVLQDGINVAGMAREIGDLVDLPEREGDILAKNDLIELTDHDSAAEEDDELPEERHAEKGESEEKGLGDFVAEVKPGGLPEGKHEGEITEIEKREVDVGGGNTAEYVDFFIDADEAETKAGFPLNITQQSRLGKLLKRFGHELKVGENVDVQEILIGARVSFLVQEDDEGYSNVVPSSVKPAE